MRRLFLVSGNKIKGSILKPAYQEKFHVRVDPDFMNVEKIPLKDTADITAILGKVKQNVGDLTPTN